MWNLKVTLQCANTKASFTAALGPQHPTSSVLENLHTTIGVYKTSLVHGLGLVLQFTPNHHFSSLGCLTIDNPFHAWQSDPKSPGTTCFFARGRSNQARIKSEQDLLLTTAHCSDVSIPGGLGLWTVNVACLMSSEFLSPTGSCAVPVEGRLRLEGTDCFQPPIQTALSGPPFSQERGGGADTPL